MSENTYLTVLGMVTDFEQRTGQNNAGDPVKNVTIRSATSDKLVKLALWRELSKVELSPGDVVVANGKAEVKSYNKADGTQGTENLLTPYTLTKLTAQVFTNPRDGEGTTAAAPTAATNVPAF